jgi:type IV secretory pathway TraG/TraD family ATPase VirD4
MSWGPSQERARPNYRRRFRLALVAGWFLAGLGTYQEPRLSDAILVLGLMVGLWWLLSWLWGKLPRRSQDRFLSHAPLPKRWLGRGPRPGAVVQLRAGVHLGVDRRGHQRRARSERAVLVLGPPRSGKTTCVIIPTLLSHAGPAVSTSTKPDVLAATGAVRGQRGQVWQFDPTGTTLPPEGVQALRWSPVLCATDWDGALLMARAMVTGAHVGHGTSDASHWTRRAQALLAPLLHAAAVGGRQIADVVQWVARHELDEPGALILEHHGTRLAADQLVGLQNTEGRERSSIFSAAADALDAYTSTAALAAAGQPNFFSGRFVTSTDTIYIHAPAEHQHLAAPLVCGLLSEIRRATYQHHRDATLPQPVLLALDEVANIAPLAELPQIASEGGSQGIVLLAALQDLSQARARWDKAADGFLTLFGTKLILPGIADQTTLDTISTVLGEYDRRVVAHTSTTVRGQWLPQRGHTVSTQRQRVLSPGQIANIPTGRALHLDGVRWELLALTPAHSTEPWRALTQPSAQ